MSKKREQTRKSKGRFSVLDEFSDTVAPAVVYSPKLSEEELKVIEEKTKLADLPSSLKLNAQKLSPNLNEQGSPLTPGDLAPTSHMIATTNGSLKSNNEDAKMSEQKRSSTGSDSDQYRSNIGSIPDLIDINIGAISDQSRSIPKILKDHSESNIGAKSRPNDLSLRDLQLEDNRDLSARAFDSSRKVDSEQSRISIGAVSEFSESIGANSYKSMRNVGAGSGSVQEQDLIYILAPLNRRIVCFLASECFKRGSLQTPPLSYERISEACETTTETAKTQIKRMEKQQLITRITQKKGPGSWTVFGLPQSIYDACFRFGLGDNFAQTLSLSKPQSVGASIGVSRGVEASSSSSYNINTTTEEQVSELWKDIRIPPTVERNGITSVHIKQILNDKNNQFSVEEVQECLDNFAIDLEKGVLKIHSSPVLFFMGIVRKNRMMYESKYMSEQLQKDIDANFKITHKSVESEKQRAQIEFFEKAKAWISGLSTDERNQIAKPNNLVEEGSALQDRMLQAYFAKENGFDFEG